MMIISTFGRTDVSPADVLLCRNELGSHLPHQDEGGGSNILRMVVVVCNEY